MSKQGIAKGETTASSFHVFVLWRKARPFRERILADLALEFTVLERVDVRWPWWRTPMLLRSFYLDRRWIRWIRKAVTCGAWSFEAVLVRDDHPDIALQREEECCAGENRRIRTVKKKYRQWTGGRWRVHASATPEETRYQYRFLTGRELGADKLESCRR